MKQSMKITDLLIKKNNEEFEEFIGEENLEYALNYFMHEFNSPFEGFEFEHKYTLNTYSEKGATIERIVFKHIDTGEFFAFDIFSNYNGIQWNSNDMFPVEKKEVITYIYE